MSVMDVLNILAASVAILQGALAIYEKIAGLAAKRKNHRLHGHAIGDNNPARTHDPSEGL